LLQLDVLDRLYNDKDVSAHALRSPDWKRTIPVAIHVAWTLQQAQFWSPTGSVITLAKLVEVALLLA
jgi:hypothetical protein